MQFRVTEQLLIGAWLSTAVMLAILSRSAEMAGSILLLGAVATAPMFATRGLKSAHTPLRRLSMGIIVAVTALIVVGLLSGIERVYVVNGNSYPRWLASGELGNVDDATIAHLRATVCQNDPIEIYQKKNIVVLRCGFAFYEPSTKTFIADSYNLGGKQ